MFTYLNIYKYTQHTYVMYIYMSAIIDRLCDLQSFFKFVTKRNNEIY